MSDDNKVKLLKIQHALLEALAEKKIHAETEEKRISIENELAINLLKYKELVTQIEHGIYLQLQEKLNALTATDHTLEDELLALEEIENFYNQLVEVQSRFKQTYALYSNTPLILSDINKLNIHLYNKRKEAIKGYLINKKNVADSKKTLEKISDELIIEEQKETRIEKKIAFLDEEIIRRVLSSEGRLLEKENHQETLKYTSIASEYQNIGITIDKNGYSGKQLDELVMATNETKEKLVAATISYEVMPDIEKKKILDEIRIENISANYRLVMGKLLEEIYTSSKNCQDAIQKRERIKDLLQYRKTYLENLGIKHGVDPFTRLHITEQLDELKQYENNSRVIARLRRELANINSRIETLEAENVQNLTILEESKLELENPTESEIAKPTSEPSFNDFIIDIKPAEVRILDNQVTHIKDVAPNFNHKKCQQITQNVIKRVYEVLMSPKINQPRNSAPELVIEASSPIYEETGKTVTPQSPNQEELFTEIMPFTNNDSLPKQESINEPEVTVSNSIDDANREDTFKPLPSQDNLSFPDIVSQSNNDKYLEPIVEPLVTEIPNITSIDLAQQLPDSSETPKVEPVAAEAYTMPQLFTETNNDSMNSVVNDNLNEFDTADIFNDITPFESPIMFSEKIDPDEGNTTIESTANSTTNSPELPASIENNEFSNMELELEENNLTTEPTDFWSTDANINNIAVQTPILTNAIKPRRKGL